MWTPFFERMEASGAEMLQRADQSMATLTADSATTLIQGEAV